MSGATYFRVKSNRNGSTQRICEITICSNLFHVPSNGLIVLLDQSLKTWTLKLHTKVTRSPQSHGSRRHSWCHWWQRIAIRFQSCAGGMCPKTQAVFYCACYMYLCLIKAHNGPICRRPWLCLCKFHGIAAHWFADLQQSAARWWPWRSQIWSLGMYIHSSKNSGHLKASFERCCSILYLAIFPLNIMIFPLPCLMRPN